MKKNTFFALVSVLAICFASCGSHPTDNEIAKILDDFYFNKDIEGIAELVETGGWRFPDLHVKDLFVRKVNVK